MLSYRLTRVLVAQLHLKDIGDVGLKSPAHAADFFQRARFGADREGSIPMTLSLDHFRQRSSAQSQRRVELTSQRLASQIRTHESD